MRFDSYDELELRSYINVESQIHGYMPKSGTGDREPVVILDREKVDLMLIDDCKHPRRHQILISDMLRQ